MKSLPETDLEELSSDAGIIKVRPSKALVAETEGDVERAVAEAVFSGTPLTARGGGTSIPSQSVGAGVILLQRSEEQILRGSGNVVCHPATVKADLNSELATSGLWVPVDPSSFRSCTVGGMVANNSSGLRTPKYGSTIDYVLRLRAVLPMSGLVEVKPVQVDQASSAGPELGRVAELLLEHRKEIEEERPNVTKNSSGYRLERVLHDDVVDFPKLFVGSEGTLGIATKIAFRVLEKPKERILLVVEAELDELGEVVREFRRMEPTAVELVDKKVFKEVGRERMLARYSRASKEFLVFCEFDGTHAQVTSKMDEVAASPVGQYDPLVVASPLEVDEAWGVRNGTLNLAQEIKRANRILVPGVEDLVAPPERLSDLVALLRDQFERRGLTYITYGHAADANLHSRPLLDPNSRADMGILDELMQECFEAVWKMKGSITGEHGDGILRSRFVEGQYPKTYHLMKEIKRTLDPKWVMNPGVKIR